MDGEKSEMSVDNDEDLTLWGYYKKQDNSDLSLLYPELPKDYFRDKGDVFEKRKNPIEKVIDEYNNLPIKPYIKKRDLNNTDDAPGENKPVDAYEIGIRIDF